MFGVDDGDDAIELVLAFDPLVDEKALDHRSRVGEAGRFNHQSVELRFVFEQLKQAAQEIAAHGAANTTVAHLHDFLVRGDQQMVVDSHFAELIDDDGDPAAMFGGEYAIEKGCFSRAQKTRQYGNRDSFVGIGAHFLSIPLKSLDES